jgi:predicted transcriptional regulator
VAQNWEFLQNRLAIFRGMRNSMSGHFPGRISMDTADQNDLVELTAEIVSAYVSNNDVRPDQLPTLIADVHAALARAPEGSKEPEPTPQTPAVSVRRSVTPDYIMCLEDGKKFKSLRRHLQSEHGMTPDEYRAKWGLKRDYPMVAPNYSESRSALARSLGLGRKPGGAAAEAPPPRGRGRRASAAAEK